MRAVVVYVHALLIYLLITLPTIAIPLMYVMSAIYAFIFGFASCGVFTLIYLLVKNAELKLQTSFTVLSITIPVAVAVGHTLIGVFISDMDVWDFNPFLGFPAVAVISGWISLYANRKPVKEDLTGEVDPEFPIVI
jgi:MFS family permease